MTPRQALANFQAMRMLVGCNCWLTIGSFLLPIEFPRLQSLLGSFLLTRVAFCLHCEHVCLPLEFLYLQWEAPTVSNKTSPILVNVFHLLGPRRRCKNFETTLSLELRCPNRKSESLRWHFRRSAGRGILFRSDRPCCKCRLASTLHVAWPSSP